MTTFWTLYLIGLARFCFWTIDWQTYRQAWIEDFFWPLFIRGGVAVAGMRGIYVAINEYLSR